MAWPVALSSGLTSSTLTQRCWWASMHSCSRTCRPHSSTSIHSTGAWRGGGLLGVGWEEAAGLGLPCCRRQALPQCMRHSWRRKHTAPPSLSISIPFLSPGSGRSPRWQATSGMTPTALAASSRWRQTPRAPGALPRMVAQHLKGEKQFINPLYGQPWLRSVCCPALR